METDLTIVLNNVEATGDSDKRAISVERWGQIPAWKGFKEEWVEKKLEAESMENILSSFV